MSFVRKYYSVVAIAFALLAGTASAQSAFVANDRTIASRFENDAKGYVKLREQVERRLPRLPKRASPEQIQAHKAAFMTAVQNARAGASQGQIFTPEAAALVRRVIAEQFKGRDSVELRTKVFEAENKGVPIKVNVAYPESKELLDTPPTLLLALPQLPKQLQYRFVGNYLLLVDRENQLIVDYMGDALPPVTTPAAAGPQQSAPVSTTTLENSAAPAPVNRSVAVKLPSPLTLPLRDGSIRLAVFGDAGRGSREQYDLARMLNTYHIAFPFDTVLMTGDNIYGPDGPEDMKLKFENAYRALIDKGVKFYASLGNHDTPNQRFYALFNMNGEDYYRIEKGGVSFYALNSNYLDKRQLDWLRDKLTGDTNKWRIAFFHHPPFSSGGRHGSDPEVRSILPPIFAANGVDVVFTGHDHFYERIKPQDGISYFVAGAAGKIRKGDVKDRSPLTAAAFDSDLSFMLVEITGDEMYFQVVARDGKTVDSGVIKRRD
ncbi:MAG: metallophosphoesterase family protein [Pyrinomonadaceae bacterium]